MNSHGAVARGVLSVQGIGKRADKRRAVRTLLCRLRDGCKDGEGSALVEFAFIAPMFVALMLGIVILGVGLNNYMVLTDAVNVGSRAFALSRGEGALTGGDPCAYAVQMANNDAAALSQSSISYKIMWTTSASGSPVTTTYTNSCPGIQLQGGQDTVTMQATYPAIMPTVQQDGFFLWTGLGSWTLAAHSTQLVQ
jgi:Flp pilus assembly protein TadG